MASITDTAYHARGGELYVGEQTTDPALNYLFQAFQEHNFQNVDMNTEVQAGLKYKSDFKFLLITYRCECFFAIGYGYLDQNIKAGRRWGTYKAFIQPVLTRPNLSIYPYARVLKVIYINRFNF